MHDVLKLEHGFFEDGSPDYYREMVDDEAMLVVPGLGRLTKAQCVDAAGQACSWTSHRIDEVEWLDLDDEMVALSYHVVAERRGQDPYEAWMTSVWREQDGRWKLVAHQQTPV